MKTFPPTKSLRNTLLIILVTVIAVGVIFLSQEVKPAQQKVEKLLDSKQLSQTTP